MNKSRVNKYQESIEKYILENQSSPFANDDQADEKFKFVKEKFSESNKFLSVLLLTIMNSQMKKKKISIPGYSAACGIEIIYLLFKIHDKKVIYEKKYKNMIGQLIVKLSFYWVKSIKTNLDSLRRKIDSNKSSKTGSSKFNKIYSCVMNMITDDIHFFIDRESTGIDLKFQSESQKKKSDMSSFYLYKNADLNDKFKKIKLINQEIIKKSVIETICNIGELSAGLGWMLGTGTEKKIPMVKGIGKHFAMIYQLAMDFRSIDDDIIEAYKSEQKFTYNYVVNCGFQKSYQLYQEHMNHFITEANELELYSGTIKELVEMLDDIVDKCLNNTTPDLKSTFTNTMTASTK